MPHARLLANICRRSRRRLTLLGAFLVAGAAACEPAAVAAPPSPMTPDAPALRAGDDATASFGTARPRHVVELVLCDSSEELPIQVGVGPTAHGGPPARCTPDVGILRHSAAAASGAAAACRAARPPP